MKSCKEYREAAWNSLSGRWKPAVLATLAYMAFMVVVELITGDGQNIGRSLIGLVVSLAVAPVGFALYVALRDYVLGKSEEVINPVVADVKANYVRYLLGGLLMGVIIVVGCILLFIPGIIAACGLVLVPFILKDEPELGIVDVIKKSWAMMKGHKMQAFLLELSFIGWMLLGIITLGIGLLWVEPYMMSAIGLFYEDVKAEYVDVPEIAE
ncbi:MAG: DUF975 family protein [Bacteroidales bacterium]|nr:DUF975 family protein [Bacteroidales bacterium]